ncbi:endonuclease domain-containing protein [Micromonospora sp. NBC_00389]|uniref:endonuclease domain-containing protein n=1 Tax=Micromonospora sp. NBC_00389 TaxID=2903586 RepID=UPI003FA5A974
MDDLVEQYQRLLHEASDDEWLAWSVPPLRRQAKQVFPTPARTVRDRYLRQRHGITEEQYDWLLRRQNLHCALCPSERSRVDSPYLAIDHDHECCAGRGSCGRCIRGLVCSTCNSRLSLFWPTNGQEHYLGGSQGAERGMARVADRDMDWLISAEAYVGRGYVQWPVAL